jgi:hypothetical protein
MDEDNIDELSKRFVNSMKPNAKLVHLLSRKNAF